LESVISDSEKQSGPLTASESVAYHLSFETPQPVTKLKGGDETGNSARKMVLKCKACRADFDSTFSVEDFASLATDQLEAGTLHLCPNCGNLSIYELKDYREPKL